MGRRARAETRSVPPEPGNRSSRGAVLAESLRVLNHQRYGRQLKSYMNAKGAPVAIWSNGSDKIILYRPYPLKFDDTLFDIPKRGESPKDVLEAKKTLLQLNRRFNFKDIILNLEELVLADIGDADEFNEIFKLIFAKIWDEKQAEEVRPDKTVEFGKSTSGPQITYDRINGLFKKASEEWPGISKPDENIELLKDHLHIARYAALHLARRC
jgi:type I restriction enzyme M protein